MKLNEFINFKQKYNIYKIFLFKKVDEAGSLVTFDLILDIKILCNFRNYEPTKSHCGKNC